MAEAFYRGQTSLAASVVSQLSHGCRPSYVLDKLKWDETRQRVSIKLDPLRKLRPVALPAIKDTGGPSTSRTRRTSGKNRGRGATHGKVRGLRRRVADQNERPLLKLKTLHVWCTLFVQFATLEQCNRQVSPSSCTLHTCSYLLSQRRPYDVHP